MPIFIVLGLLLLALGAWLGWPALRRRRRAALLDRPLPGERRKILEQSVPLYRRLPSALRERLHGLVNIFLAEKRFEGCAGLAVTEEMRVTIAGHACLLLLGRGHTFPGFRSILVYPDAFVSPQTEYDGMVEIRGHSVRSGESWHRGPVVLAWSDILEDLEYPDDGHNVVLHEFAHKLDEENENMDGLPRLSERSQYAEWAEVLGREYDRLQRGADAGEESVLDHYGAVSPAEFFAVATEAFFLIAGTMRDRLPDLYDQLRRFYGVDPAEWRD